MLCDFLGVDRVPEENSPERFEVDRKEVLRQRIDISQETFKLSETEAILEVVHFYMLFEGVVFDAVRVLLHLLEHDLQELVAIIV